VTIPNIGNMNYPAIEFPSQSQDMPSPLDMGPQWPPMVGGVVQTGPLHASPLFIAVLGVIVWKWMKRRR
jgi:hypothetical protein